MDCRTRRLQSKGLATNTLCQNLHFVFLELCARPEYVELIYQEIRNAGDLDYEGIDRLPILDSFIKESVRLNPLDKSTYAIALLESH